MGFDDTGLGAAMADAILHQKNKNLQDRVSVLEAKLLRMEKAIEYMRASQPDGLVNSSIKEGVRT